MKRKVILSLTTIIGLGMLAINGEDVSAAGKELYRLYNPNSGEHFYTLHVGEKNNLINAGWNDEGIGWYTPDTGEQVYRLYNPHTGDHHYTKNKGEYDSLVSLGWQGEGRSFLSDTEKTVPIYRAYNKNAQTGAHNFTADKGEQAGLIRSGWSDEGIGFYGITNEQADPKAKVQAELAKAKAVKADDYTPESFSILQAAITSVETALNSHNLTTDELSMMSKVLEDGMKGLVKIGTDEKVDKTILQAIIELGKQLPKEQFTIASYNSFNEALQAGIKTLAEETATQKQVNEAIEKIMDTQRKLVKRPAVNAPDWLGLSLAINDAYKILNEGNFTTNSRNALLTTIKQSSDLLTQPNTTTTKVSAAIRELKRQTATTDNGGVLVEKASGEEIGNLTYILNALKQMQENDYMNYDPNDSVTVEKITGFDEKARLYINDIENASSKDVAELIKTIDDFAASFQKKQATVEAIEKLKKVAKNLKEIIQPKFTYNSWHMKGLPSNAMPIPMPMNDYLKSIEIAASFNTTGVAHAEAVYNDVKTVYDNDNSNGQELLFLGQLIALSEQEGKKQNETYSYDESAFKSSDSYTVYKQAADHLKAFIEKSQSQQDQVTTQQEIDEEYEKFQTVLAETLTQHNRGDYSSDRPAFPTFN